MANKENVTEIEWGTDHWKKITNEKFWSLINCEDRFCVLWGGRGSSKSRFVATKIVYRMLTEDFFRCVLIRNVHNTIKSSSFKMILDVIEDLGLSSLFKHTDSNALSITCANGNSIIARGMDSPQGIKSIAEISLAWYEEDLPTEEGFITVSTSIRTTKSKYVQEIFTINPECEGDFHEHWFYKRFFEKNAPVKSFRNTTVLAGKNGVNVELGYTVHHSTYKDNRYLSDQYIAMLMDYKTRSPYYYQIYVLGEWGQKENKAGFYKCFDRGLNVFDNIKYDCNKPIHVSLDFNCAPHMTATVWQLSDDMLSALCVDEIITQTPNNTAKGIGREILRKYGHHKSGCFIYGDASGRHKDTRSEVGVNDYSLILGFIQDLTPRLRVPSANPRLMQRGDFINETFKGMTPVKILISEQCPLLINDVMFTKENPEGGKQKQMVTRENVSYQLYGHMSDTMDYFLCEIFKGFYNKNKNGGKIFEFKTGKTPWNEKHKY